MRSIKFHSASGTGATMTREAFSSGTMSHAVMASIATNFLMVIILAVFVLFFCWILHHARIKYVGKSQSCMFRVQWGTAPITGIVNGVMGLAQKAPAYASYEVKPRKYTPKTTHYNRQPSLQVA